MKKVILFFTLFFITANLFAENELLDDLDYYRVYTNYNGSAYNGSGILVYGEGGVIVKTTDDGDNWKQINLNDEFNITGAVSINGDYFAATNTDLLLKSTDNGDSWSEHRLPGDVRSLKLAAYDGSIYCLTDKNVIILSPVPEVQNIIPLDNVAPGSDLSVNDGYLVYAAGEGKEGKLGILNLESGELKIKDMMDFDLCNVCFVPRDIYNTGNMIYFSQNNDLCRYDIDNDEAELIFHPVKSGNYAYRNGEIYELYNVFLPYMNLDSMYFVKINETTKTATHIKNPGNDRYISELEFRDVSFVSDDLIVAVGEDKLIYFSYDGGRTWDLKSHFNCSSEHGKIIRFDELNAARISDHAKFVKTTDGGTTWLPQKNYNPTFADDYFGDFLNYGTTFFKNRNVGFQFRVQKWNTGNDTTFVYTGNGCETVKFRAKTLAGYINSDDFITITGLDTILFVFPGILAGNNNYYNYTMINRLNDSMEEINRTVLDSAHVIFIDDFGDGELYAITVNLKSPRTEDGKKIYDNRYCSLMKSTDNGYTWQNEVDFWSEFEFRPIPLKSMGENIFLGKVVTVEDSYFSHLYKLNINTKQLEKIYSCEKCEFSSNGITEIDGKIYLIKFDYKGNRPVTNLIVNEDIINSTTDWKPLNPHERYGLLNPYAKNDKLVTIHSYDSLMQSTVVWFAKVKEGTSVADSEVNSTKGLYMSSPFPLPAENQVTVRIWWDRSYDINKAHITASNILGEKVAKNAQFDINQLNSYSAELVWRFEDLSTGVYFITVNLEGSSRSVPIIVR